MGAESIATAVAEAGPLDTLMNNAGVGMLNVLEGAEIDRARELFETNVLKLPADAETCFREEGLSAA